MAGSRPDRPLRTPGLLLRPATSLEGLLQLWHPPSHLHWRDHAMIRQPLHSPPHWGPQFLDLDIFRTESPSSTVRLPWALSLFKDWVCFGFFISLSFSFFSFSSVSIIHFVTISVVCVVMDIFLNQGASKLFIDFCFVFAEVRSSWVFCTCACVLLLRWS